MAKTFRLLKLPTIPMFKIIKFIDRIGLINLSICSKIFWKTVKKYIEKPEKVMFSMDGEFRITINFGSTHNEWIIYSKDKSFENTPFLPVSGSVEMTEWDEFPRISEKKKYEMKNYEIRKWLNCFMKIFDCPLTNLMIRDFINRFKIIEIKNLLDGLKIENVRIGYFIHNSYLKMILETIQVSKSLFIPSINQPASLGNIVFNTDELIMESSDPLIMNPILISNCRIIKLGWSNFTNKDFNEFLKNWKNGSNQKLEQLSAMNEKKGFWNKYSIINGLEATFKQSDPNDYLRQFHIIAEIYRNDNRKASINVQNYDFCSMFSFIVSPENS